jgi:hypothetical protein
LLTTHAQIDRATPPAPLDNLFNALRLVAVVWLLLVGLWSGPWLGASLVYPNGLLTVEIVLALLLILLSLRGQVQPLRAYPFFIPGVAVLGLCAVSAACRIFARGTTLSDETMSLWQHGEPLLRGVLLYLAIAGQPRLARVAWYALLGGLALQAGAAVIQHFTNVTRWYANLDSGWVSGWHPVHVPPVGSGPQPAPRVQGLTSYINLTAALLAASLPYWSVPLALNFLASRKVRALLFLGALATLAALWYTNSRGPMLAVFAVVLLVVIRLPQWRIAGVLALAAFLAAVFPALPGWALMAFAGAIVLLMLARRWKFRYLLPIALAMGVGGGLLVVDAYAMHYQLGWRVSQQGGVDNARLTLYRDALYTAASSPWWGVGDRAVAERVIQLPKLENLPVTQRNYHDQYLHWAAAEGFPVALALTCLVCWAVVLCWRQYPAWQNPHARALGLATAMGLTIFLLCNLVDAHFWRIEGGGFFWSLLGVTFATGTTASDNGNSGGQAHDC